MKFLALIVLLFLVPLEAAAIDCKHADSKVAKMICESNDLVALDARLNAVYRAALKHAGNPDRIRRDQRAWVKLAQEGCDSTRFLSVAYLNRINELTQAISPWCEKANRILDGAWFRVGEDGFFEEFSVDREGSFDSWLHQRPEISGGTLIKSGCTIQISSDSGELKIKWLLLDAQPARISVFDFDAADVARYKRVAE